MICSIRRHQFLYLNYTLLSFYKLIYIIYPYLYMTTAFSGPAAAQTQIWMFRYDFIKGLIDTEGLLSFRNKIAWVFESRSQSLTINHTAQIHILLLFLIYLTTQESHIYIFWHYLAFLWSWYQIRLTECQWRNAM